MHQVKLARKALAKLSPINTRDFFPRYHRHRRTSYYIIVNVPNAYYYGTRQCRAPLRSVYSPRTSSIDVVASHYRGWLSRKKIQEIVLAEREREREIKIPRASSLRRASSSGRGSTRRIKWFSFNLISPLYREAEVSPAKRKRNLSVASFAFKRPIGIPYS